MATNKQRIYTSLNNYNKIDAIGKHVRKNKHWPLVLSTTTNLLLGSIYNSREIMATCYSITFNVYWLHEYASRNKNYSYLSKVSSNCYSTFFNILDDGDISSFSDGKYVCKLVYESDMVPLLEQARAFL